MTEISLLDRLVAQDEIRQQLALFALLIDGDGKAKSNRRAFADRIFTTDAVTEVFHPEGALVAKMSGREEIANVAHTRPKELAGRHCLMAGHFDEVTVTSAETRTPALYLEATKELPGEAGSGGKVMRTSLLVYHHRWRKTEEGWQISYTALRRDT